MYVMIRTRLEPHARQFTTHICFARASRSVPCAQHEQEPASTAPRHPSVNGTFPPPGASHLPIPAPPVRGSTLTHSPTPRLPAPGHAPWRCPRVNSFDLPAPQPPDQRSKWSCYTSRHQPAARQQRPEKARTRARAGAREGRRGGHLGGAAPRRARRCSRPPPSPAPARAAVGAWRGRCGPASGSAAELFGTYRRRGAHGRGARGAARAHAAGALGRSERAARVRARGAALRAAVEDTDRRRQPLGPETDREAHPRPRNPTRPKAAT